jgi:hypothetical protein
LILEQENHDLIYFPQGKTFLFAIENYIILRTEVEIALW